MPLVPTISTGSLRTIRAPFRAFSSCRTAQALAWGGRVARVPRRGPSGSHSRAGRQFVRIITNAEIVPQDRILGLSLDPS
jgi:hypothetical protein